ncbi:MAG: hypothetical protein RL596_810 [Bacteroidota bacterium]|jgi:hypothetical protein
MENIEDSSHASDQNNEIKEPELVYGFVVKSPEEKLLDLINRSDLEKLQAFTRMLRRNATLKRGKVLGTNNKQ